ncbi:MAG: magnesium transporter MgtC [Candidatus Nealsonbacteria bacterium CG02_land_8_20_14_3_00_37_10]|uniref:Magnesium transporter MgtC n=2 Tax=Candidatus Nealsoniibacteriota TaxID=1817911 RepID=A0A2G9YYN7_9BACT|nr:MAG: magnesium transporter MgtC [Candidatus Nealsonbacteria bacterium CG23_combo_of_CG06-09_8_20_14_all_37_18]PIV45000.1 MAG: magnesium transporter MgtC [Candidatus Nealsonbacteria bacterium CG02_land_8_20_14_3_00_37_10]
MVFSESFQIVIQLFLAVLLGGLIGLEREYKRKEAGLQTFSLVTLGSCLFTLVSSQFVGFNPALIAVGIGFIGAGVIFRQSSGTVGLTTAAGLWATAAIGIAIGSQLYFLAVIGTFLTLFIFAGFGLLERKIFKKETRDKGQNF